jgi:hypothetical protein
MPTFQHCHNEGKYRDKYKMKPTPVSLGACMGIMLINFPKALYDVECRDE